MIPLHSYGRLQNTTALSLCCFVRKNSDPELGNMELHSLPVLAALSLVPRPHPLALTRRNGLVNQVEFLGLVYAFVTV